MIGIAKVFSDIACGCVRVIVCLFLLERLITAQRPQRRCIAAGGAGGGGTGGPRRAGGWVPLLQPWRGVGR